MVDNEIPKDLTAAVEFHGHLCPGLVMGYLAAKVGLERLGPDRAEDEELIAIVENDSCAVNSCQPESAKRRRMA
jgi:formylmethanofuran dehydrogenase subunit E